MSNNFTAPTIIKRIEQTEINDVSRLVSDAHVLPVALVRSFLEKRGKSEKQIENILNQMVKRKLAYYDETKNFLKINKAFSLNDVNNGVIKSIWLMLDLFNNISEYFIQNTNPHTLTFFNSTAEKDGLYPIYDVFYFPYGREQLDTYILNEMANSADCKINAFIIVDSEEQISRLSLSAKIQLVSFVLVSPEGQITYLEGKVK